MAETDGTPSAPTPSDGDKPAEAGAKPAVAVAPVAPVVTVVRPAEVNSTEATRAALRKTLQAGVAFQPTSGSSEPAPELTDQARRMAALADTQQDLSRSTPGAVTQPPRPSRNPKLARTLRMDLKVPPATDEPAPPQVIDTPAVTSSPARTVRPHVPTQHGVPIPHIQPHIQPAEFSSTRPAYSVGPDTRPAAALDSHVRDPRHVHEAGALLGAAPGPGTTRRSNAPPGLPRKRPLRPGERTMVMSKRRSGRKDWLFVVLVVGALGVTASMLLSYRGTDPEAAEGEVAEGEAPPEEEPVAEDTALQAASQDPTPQPASSGVRATELRSEPAGAEVVVNGAVIGNTPVRVARSGSDVDYTLRLPGFESMVVRVGAQSPASISVTLRRSGQ